MTTLNDLHCKVQEIQSWLSDPNYGKDEAAIALDEILWGLEELRDKYEYSDLDRAEDIVAMACNTQVAQALTDQELTELLEYIGEQLGGFYEYHHIEAWVKSLKGEEWVKEKTNAS